MFPFVVAAVLVVPVQGVPAGAGDSARRIAVTAQHLATAFRTEEARTLLTRARRARLAQDSALVSYDAKAYQRISIGLSLRDNGREREVIRDDEAARVQWQRGVGAVVDLLGKRTAVPTRGSETAGDSLPSSASLPIPYFPGRDPVWIGGSVARVEVDERQLVHPIAEGAEAYYQYRIGDSVKYELPGGVEIMLREIRVSARQPRWNLIVGSFWFDEATAQLVRAVYRMSVPMDVLKVTADEHKRDSSRDDVPLLLKPIISPVNVSIELLSIEYSLFEGRFWLPAKQIAEGRGQISLVHLPVLLEERFEYAHINGEVEVSAVLASMWPAEPAVASAKSLHDSVFAATGKINQGVVDSIVAARERVAHDSVRAQLKRACRDPGAHFIRRALMYDNSLDVVTRIPCDPLLLANSPDLPPVVFDEGTTVFSKREHDERLGTLDFGLQAGWAPQRVTLNWGLGQSWYNRVEGFSTGIVLREELGRGYAWSLQLRGSQGDRQVNGAAGIERSNGRTTYKVNAYRRLASANDWGSPFSFSASLPALLYARDEAFFYRAWGGEITRSSAYDGRLAWRAFAEQQWDAPVTTTFSLFGGRRDHRFVSNVVAARGTYVGAAVQWKQNWARPMGSWSTRLDANVEVAGGTTNYGRGAFDLTIAHSLFEPISVSLTAASGSSVGDPPPQRGWFLGGSRTVRGEDAGVASGNAFWLTRVELARDSRNARASVFADLGWAGAREQMWDRSVRPLAGLGFGTSFLSGLMRLDLAWGVWPKEQRRRYFSLETRF